MRRSLITAALLLFLLGTLHSGTPQLNLISPAGGESIVRGSEFRISWESQSLGGMVRLILIKGSTRLGRIARDLPPSGDYVWKVGNPLENPAGTTYPNGNDYRIRVVSQDNGEIRDQNSRYFSITGTLQRQAEFKIPPRLLQFEVAKSEAESGRFAGQEVHVAGSRQVILTSRVMGGGADAYRVQVSGQWSEWKAPYQSQIYYHIPDNNCQEHTISFQVKNDNGASNIMTKKFVYAEDRAVWIKGGEAGDWARQNGFTHLIISKDGNAEPEINFQLPNRMILAVYKKDRFKYAEAVFEIFGGRELNPGWGYQDIKIVLPTGYGGYKVIRKPDVNSRDIKFQVKIWVNSGIQAMNYCWIQVDQIRLKGPCDKNWKEAFRR